MDPDTAAGAAGGASRPPKFGGAAPDILNRYLPIALAALGIIALAGLVLAGWSERPARGLLLLTTLAASIALALITWSWWLANSSRSGIEARVGDLRDRLARLGPLTLAERFSGIGTWRHDLRAQTLEWSDGTYRLLGYDRDTAPPSAPEFEASIHMEDRPRWIECRQRVLDGVREARVEFRYMKPSGQAILLRCLMRPERDATGHIIALGGIHQDISGMRAMQQQLAASESKFRDLTQMSSDWVWETDADLRLVYLSESIDVVVGRWIRNTIGKRPWEVPQPGFLTPDWGAHRTLLEERKPFHGFEYSQIDPDGNVYHLTTSGRPVFTATGKFMGFRGVGRNVTREREQRLLLEITGEIATVMREQTEPDRVITAILILLAGRLGWSGGAHLVRVHGLQSYKIRERWGYPAFTSMISELPPEIPFSNKTVEGHAWRTGRPLWLRDVHAQKDFAKRFQCLKLDAQAAFLAPILDEQGQTISLLMFLSPYTFKGDRFLVQISEMLSRTLSLYLQRKRAEQRLLHASMHDALTGLPNRTYLKQQLESRLKRHEPAAVLYVDLDRYKLINDTLGHQVGDRVLVEVARRLRTSIRPSDVAGRIGGDEFILLLTGLDDRVEIERIARRALAALEKPFVLKGRAYFISASIGAAVAPRDGEDPELLLKCADHAMYEVKSDGRNDVRFFSGTMSDERIEQLQLVAELPMAIKRGELDLYYQPIMDVGARRVIALEALLRWRHPTRGLLLPDRFVPAAEQSNLIRELGDWVLKRALDDRLDLGDTGGHGAVVSVNTSPRQLSEEGFLETLNRMFEEREIAPSVLQLELTESAFIDDPDKTIGILNELRRLGVRVVIDNFGTGYASLSYLKNLPIDGLKIDHAFIKDLPADRGNAAIVQAITTLAAKLGLKAMAEGVETPNELRALRSLECDQIQGTVISEALPYAQLKEFLESLPVVRQMHLVKDGGNAPS